MRREGGEGEGLGFFFVFLFFLALGMGKVVGEKELQSCRMHQKGETWIVISS